jgi:hypothetical protein
MRKSVGIYKNIKYIMIDMTAHQYDLFSILLVSFLTVCFYLLYFSQLHWAHLQHFQVVLGRYPVYNMTRA